MKCLMFLFSVCLKSSVASMFGFVLVTLPKSCVASLMGLSGFLA